jgi:type I restriction enzyme S subunit
MTPAMPSDAKPKLTPKLRFPEFRNKPAWTGKPMGEVYSFKGNNSLSRDQLNYDHGSVKNIHYGDIHTKFSTHFDITKETVPFINPSESLDGFRPDNDCVEGDMIFADASEDLEDIGKSIEVVRLNDERVVSGQHTILARPNDDSLAVGFGAYLFKSRYVRTQIQKESQGSKVLGISATRLTKIELPIPSTKPEQQKIAECLGTLDELMGAESQKLAALKAHKKGLMQQLFLRAGETRPRLRFPEFQNAPEWEEDKLGSVCELYQPVTLSASELSMTGEYLVYGANGIIGSHREYNHEESEIAVTCRGATCGEVTTTKPKSWITGNAMVVKPRTDNLRKDFIFHYFKNHGLKSVISGSAQPQITRAGFAPLVVFFPKPEEQKRIATCLSSLDELIDAQGEQIETLKTHKQRLMQQLFPSPSEAES